MKTSLLLRRYILPLTCVTAVMGVRLTAADAAPDAGTAPAASTAPAAPVTGTSYLFAAPPEGQVLTPGNRVKLLTAVKTFIVRDNPAELAKLQSLDNPFYKKLPPAPEPVAASTGNSTTTANSNTPPAPAKLTDDDKLKMVAAALKPTGLMEAANQRLVTFASRDPLNVGDSFPVPFPNEATATTIQLIDANDTSCVLKIGSSTLSVDYAANTPAPRPATPAPAPSSSTSKPSN
jgi:hypothetical protein